MINNNSDKINDIISDSDEDKDPEKMEYIQKLMNEKNIDISKYDQLIKERKEKQRSYIENNKKLIQLQERSWLMKTGKQNRIDFSDQERMKLKKYFNSLDEDGSGAIGLEELEDPLISLGMAESKEEVKKIIDEVDDNGEIEFKEFLDIIKGKENKKTPMQNSQAQQISSSSQASNELKEFFKNMIDGTLGQKMGVAQISSQLPFPLIISTVRRQKLLDAIMSDKVIQKEKGGKVLKAYQKLLSVNRANKISQDFNIQKE